MYRKKDEDDGPVGKCLECGRPVYGRTDKKFCSIDCKNKYNYKEIKASNLFRGRVIRYLNSNYRILTELLKKNMTSMSLADLEALGFRRDVFTYSTISKERHEEKRCFDIRYCQTSKRIFKISRITY